MARGALRLIVELDTQEAAGVEDTSTTGTISGRVQVAGQPDREFVGWLQLLAYLDETIRGAGAGVALDLRVGEGP
jgi:hypothetical protein